MDASAATKITLQGRLIRKQTFGDWAVGVFEEFGGTQRKVVGALVETMEPLQPYELVVHEVTHPKHGLQLEAQSVAPYIGLERASLSNHLCRNFNGVGPKTAAQIIRWYEDKASLEELRRVLAYEPWKLHGFMTAGTTKGIEFIYQAKSAYSYFYTYMATRFGATGVSDPVIRRLSKWLTESISEETTDPVGDAFKLLAQDPYKPMLYVWGYSFSDADALASVMGGKSDDPVRLGAMAFNALKTCSGNEGHTYIPLDVLRRRILETDFGVDAKQAIEYATKLKYPIEIEEGVRCYHTPLMEAENDCASMIAALLMRCYPLRGFASEGDLISEIKKAELAAGWNHPLDESQRKAVIAMLHSNQRLHTVTAGPGSGKTATMEVFAQVAGMKVIFMAPTGKAAKVLYARVAKYGFQATTIHQALEPSLEGFLRNEDRPLEAEIVVVDEASMLELTLAHALLLALPATAHLVLMGDFDQLQSIGPGNFLHDVLTLKADHQRLEHTHRNAGTILNLIRGINKGEFTPPDHDDSSEVMHLQLDMKDELSFDFLEDSYLDAVGRYGLQSTVLLVPNRKGKRDVKGWNTTYLNHRLQAILNATGGAVPGTQFRINDRVIIRRNMELDGESGQLVPVVNGDTGSVCGHECTEEGQLVMLRVLLDDGRNVNLGREFLDLIDLSYATTVHAAQGSEYQCVICVIANGPSSFLNRSVLYTALSRTKRELQLFGSTKHLQGIARRAPAARFSALATKVEREISDAQTI